MKKNDIKKIGEKVNFKNGLKNQIITGVVFDTITSSLVVASDEETFNEYVKAGYEVIDYEIGEHESCLANDYEFEDIDVINEEYIEEVYEEDYVEQFKNEEKVDYIDVEHKDISVLEDNPYFWAKDIRRFLSDLDISDKNIRKIMKKIIKLEGNDIDKNIVNFYTMCKVLNNMHIRMGKNIKTPTDLENFMFPKLDLNNYYERKELNNILKENNIEKEDIDKILQKNWVRDYDTSLVYYDKKKLKETLKNKKYDKSIIKSVMNGLNKNVVKKEEIKVDVKEKISFSNKVKSYFNKRKNNKLAKEMALNIYSYSKEYSNMYLKDMSLIGIIDWKRIVKNLILEIDDYKEKSKQTILPFTKDIEIDDVYEKLNSIHNTLMTYGYMRQEEDVYSEVIKDLGNDVLNYFDQAKIEEYINKTKENKKIFGFGLGYVAIVATIFMANSFKVNEEVEDKIVDNNIYEEKEELDITIAENIEEDIEEIFNEKIIETKEELDSYVDDDYLEKEENVVTDNYLRIGDNLDIVDNARVYLNVGDLSNNENSKQSYYGSNSEIQRSVRGIALQKDKDIKMLYNNEDLEQYLDDDYKVIGYQVDNMYSYDNDNNYIDSEGLYDNDDVYRLNLRK